MSYGSGLPRSIYYQLPLPIKNFVASAYGAISEKSRNGSFYKKYYALAEESQWWSPDKLETYVSRQVADFLAFLKKENAFYQKRLGGTRPGMSSFRLDDLLDIPVMDKASLRANFSEIVGHSGKLGKLHIVQTSGTTGLGLKLLETQECFEREYAFRFQNYGQSGVKVGEPWAFVAGHPVAHPDRTEPPFWVTDKANNWLLMSSYHLTERNLEHYIEKLVTFKPAMIGGYPSSVYLLAEAAKHHKADIRPKAVFTASETMFDFQRQAIWEAFKCPAYSYYGNAERAGFIAECPMKKMHVKPQHTYLEFLDDEDKPIKPGSAGRLVATGFGNYATPLVRYDTGDIVTLSTEQTCKCGRPGPILDSIDGRVEDYVVAADGRFFGRLDHLFKDAAKVRLAQIVQTEVGKVTIKIVPEPGFGVNEEKVIMKEARARMGPTMVVNIECVKDIPRTKSGKFRFVLSSIQNKQMFGKKVDQAAPVETVQ